MSSRILFLSALLTASMCPAAQFQKITTQFRETAAEVPFPVRQKTDPEPWSGTESGPVPGMRLYAKEKSGALWLGSTNGAARLDPQAQDQWARWQYVHDRR